MQASSKIAHIPYLTSALIIASFLMGMSIQYFWINSCHLFGIQPLATSTSMISVSCANQEQTQQIFAHADTLLQQENTEDALKEYKDILNKDHTALMGFMRLGTALCKLNKYESAEYCYRVAVLLQPSFILGYIKLGIVQHKLHKLDQALRSFTAVLLFQPDNFDALFNISRIYTDLNQFDKAIEYAKKAISLQPHNVHTHLNLGHTYNKQGDTQAACQQYQNAIAIDPLLANGHYNLGYTLRVQREPHKALPHLLKALELQPEYPDAHIALAQIYWSFGDFKTAWQHYNWRWKQLGIDPKALDIPLWDGSSLQGKTILLYTEQGMGDTLQFLRYAKHIKDIYGCTIICKVQKPLESYVKLCPYIDEIITNGQSSSHHIDVQAPLLNLPGILETTLGTIPHPIPYLYTEKERTAQWKRILASDKNIKVGLAWNVLPAHEDAKSPLCLRSIELALLAPLADIPGVSFYSLQKMDGLEQVLYLPASFKVHTFGKDFDKTPFMDSASIIANLDLIITVDTVIAHLAGGLGKPVWTLLPFSPDCRWDHHEYTTPWYKNMQLFRQPAWKEWDSVVQRLKKELQSFVKKHKK